MTTYYQENNEKRGGKKVGGKIYQKYEITLTSGDQEAGFEINTGAAVALTKV